MRIKKNKSQNNEEKTEVEVTQKSEEEEKETEGEEIRRRKDYILVGLWTRWKSLVSCQRTQVESTGWSWNRSLRAHLYKFGKNTLKLSSTFKTLNWSPFF